MPRGRGARARWWALGLFLTAAVAAHLALDRREPDAPGSATVERLWREQRSGVWVEVEGVVDRLLADDLEGHRHQRFIVRLAGGHTLLVSHNIDLAQRVPAATGDRLAVLGVYEWNERGGVLHWTHHDPSGRRTGGWIRHRGTEYR